MPTALRNIEKYSLAEPIAVSARSVLRRAHRASDGSPVILKSFHQGETGPEQRGELERELATLQRFTAPEISKAYEVCEVGGQAALVLEDCGEAGCFRSPKLGIDLAQCPRVRDPSRARTRKSSRVRPDSQRHQTGKPARRSRDQGSEADRLSSGGRANWRRTQRRARWTRFRTSRPNGPGA